MLLPNLTPPTGIVVAPPRLGRNGGTSAVSVAMTPQRLVANVRRADRPRYKPGHKDLGFAQKVQAALIKT